VSSNSLVEDGTSDRAGPYTVYEVYPEAEIRAALT